MTRRRILVPIDFCPHSDAALNYARKIAAKSNDMISCIHVIDEKRFPTDSPANPEIKRKMRRDAEYKLSERVHSVLKSENSPAFELIITSGNVHQKILEKASDLNARLIIMGRSNSRELKNRKIGSNAKYILAHAPVPVIILGEKRIVDKDYLIVSIDLSQPAEPIIKCAIDTARFLDAGVFLISIIEIEMAGFEPEYRKRLKELRKILRAHNIKCNSHLLIAQDFIADEILAFSNRIQSALILLSCRMEDDRSSSNIESTALEVIANSRVPVQCINPEYNPGFLIDELNSEFSCPL